MTPTPALAPIPITAADLPLHCPPPNAPLWSTHPRVFLDVQKTGRVSCPYCGACYELSGPVPSGH